MASSLLPVFATKNLINDVALITDNGSTSDEIKTRIFDRNEEIRYFPVGVTTGDRITSFGPFTSTPPVSVIFVQNCNWEDFEITHDASPFSPAISITGNTRKNLYFEVSNVVTDVEVKVTAIFGGGSGLAKMGEFYLGEKLFSISGNISSPGIDVVPNTAQSIFELSDGTTKKNYIRKTLNYNVPLTIVSESDRLDFENLYEINRVDSFVYINRPALIPDNWDGQANHYNWTNSNDFFNFTEDINVNGFNVNIVLGQAGGID